MVLLLSRINREKNGILCYNVNKKTLATSHMDNRETQKKTEKLKKSKITCKKGEK